MIRIIDVSKKFRIWEDRSRDLKETAINLLRGKKRSFRDLWALRGIDLEIEEGETVAFIGENGSGKSTLLKLLAGIYAPDEGKILYRGKISTLLELGVGFHPDLTGEENIYLNGAMLGFDRGKMREKFDEIVAFSDIGSFVYSPIRTYSSGMLMRLGFSIATCVNPDILLVDEILAVGDEAFQEKCLNRMKEFKEARKTIILVTHSMELVQIFCDRAILLWEGRVAYDGSPGKTIECYHAQLSSKTEGVTERKEEGNQKNQETLDQGRPSTIMGSKGGGKDEATGEYPFDQEKLKVIEVEDASYFAGHLFRDAFNEPPPSHPSNYVALYADPDDLATFHVIAFIHVGQTEKTILNEVGFIGGLWINPQWQGRGVEKLLFSTIEGKLADKKAFAVYTDHQDSFIPWGYEVVPHSYLMVKWTAPLSMEEKTRIVNAVMSVGPF